MVESQEAMEGVVHPQRVFIAAERLVVFGFRAIGAELGLTQAHVNDFLNKAHCFPFLAASTC